MSGVFVIVDEQDPDVRYSSGWGPTTAENSFEYGGTMTAPGPQGATASYVFNGTSISVFSMVGRNPNVTTTLSFAIDGEFVNSTAVQADGDEHFHHKLFGSPALQDGSHTLEITLTNVTSRDVFLDYLIYEASPNSSLNDGVRLLVLNTSPYLAYSQGWSPGLVGLRPGLIEPAISLNNSVEGAADLGATMALTFTGSGFEVRGLLVMPFPNPVASYSLDGGPWTDVQMPVNGTSYFNAVSNFEFVGQTFGKVGMHSLVITPKIPGAFFLDYIIVQSPTAAFPPKAAVAAPPAARSSSDVSGPSSTSLGTPPPLASTTNRAGLQAGAVGGIVAGLAWILLRRRRTRRSRDTTTTPSSQEYGGVPSSTTTRSAHPVSKEDRRYMVHRLNIGPANVVRAQPAINVVEEDSRRRTVAATLPPAYTDQLNRITTLSL
ncbi:hypothetical protein FB451DRAFT_1519302 [Mycena latifolia]|nr:hypothetical protein FB451DRAFT_1519302 [Mycena latifolia]